jgi:dihydroflavonol-4-reductase
LKLHLQKKRTMVVLITGITGLVGSAIAKKCLEKGYTVRGLVRNRGKMGLAQSIVSNIEVCEGDVLDILALEAAVQNVDYVIHTAAMVSFSPKDQQAMHQTNVVGTANLVNACLTANIKKMCFISSIAALGRPSTDIGSSITETQKWEESELNSYYAKTKYMAENEVWRGQAEGLSTVILNPSVVLGKGDWKKSSSQLFKYVFDQKKFYTQGQLNWVAADDLALISTQMLSEDISGQRFIVNAGVVSYQQLFKKMAERFQKKAPSVLVNATLINLIWRFEALKSFLIGSQPLITRETAISAQRNLIYDANKIKEALSFSFGTLDQTLDTTCSYFIKKQLSG